MSNWPNSKIDCNFLNTDRIEKLFEHPYSNFLRRIECRSVNFFKIISFRDTYTNFFFSYGRHLGFLDIRILFIFLINLVYHMSHFEGGKVA